MPTEEPLSDQDKLQVERKKSESQRHFRDPKKHFVRREGWLPTAQRRNARILRSGRKHPLKYFTLCGREALDVLYLASHGILQSDGRGYPGVAVCETQHDWLAEILRRLGRIRYFPDNLEMIVVDDRNPYHAEFERLIPFDVFNLDFSGVCFPRWDAPYSRTLQALRCIIALQSQAEADFDLLVTFRAERERENEDAILELQQNMEENFRKYEDTRDLFSKKYDEIDQLLGSDYCHFLLATFPKLIMRCGNDQNYKVACTDRYFYQRPPYRHRTTGQWRTYKIAKFIFLFDFQPPSAGIVQEGAIRSEALAEYYVEAIRDTIRSNPIDVDSVLRANRSLGEELKREVQQLLDGVYT